MTAPETVVERNLCEVTHVDETTKRTHVRIQGKNSCILEFSIPTEECPAPARSFVGATFWAEAYTDESGEVKVRYPPPTAEEIEEDRRILSELLDSDE